MRTPVECIGHVPKSDAKRWCKFLEDGTECGVWFKPTSPSQRYCPGHQRSAQLRRDREYRQRIAAAKRRAK